MRFFFIIATIAIVSCTNNQSQVLSKSKIDTTLVDSIPSTMLDEVSAPSATSGSNWRYTESEDKMDNSKSFFAQTTSTNEVYFDFPYNGGSSFVLTVRKRHSDGIAVVLEVSKGQFLTGIDGKMGRIKFDGEAPINMSYTEASDGSADVVFLHPESKIIKKLKAAKKIVIETEFFEAGKKQIEFDVEGLKWEH